MTTILHQMLKNFKATYILLDALDECTDREALFEFIEELMGWNIKDLHVLTTSRKENDIAMSLESLVTHQLCIQGALIDADIRVHVLKRLSNDSKLRKLPVDVQKEIEDTLMRGSNWMFRWVVCQLDSLQKCLKLDALKKALNTLPKTLDDTYERILSNLDEEYKEDALKILQWLCFSARPMRLHEMVEVLAIDSTSDFCFRPEARLLDPRDILTICSTLISVTAATKEDASTQTMKLAHFSVKEYLISDRLKRGSMHRYHITTSSANASIANTCLIYLLHFKTSSMLTAKFANEFQFIRYAAEFWPWNYRRITDDTDRETADFLGYNLVDSKNSCFTNWLRIFVPNDNRGYWIITPEKIGGWLGPSHNTDPVLSPLCDMSYLGVSGVVQLLLNNGADVNAEGGLYGHALSAASYKGHKEVVRLLVENGANVNAKGGVYGPALSAASYDGHEDVVLFLLEKGANVNAEGGIYEHALSAASNKGHKELVQLLVEKGAKVNARGGIYGHALSAASCNSHKELVLLLLQKGANVNAEGGFCGPPLSAASHNGHKELVRLLLEKGADVNAQKGRALRQASRLGHEATMRLLLQNKADVNLVLDDDGKGLQGISVENHEAVIRLLRKEFEEVQTHLATAVENLSSRLIKRRGLYNSRT